MLGVPGVEFPGDQDLHRLAQKLVASVAEHVLGDAVQENDPAFGVHLHDGVRSSFQQFAKSLFEEHSGILLLGTSLVVSQSSAVAIEMRRTQ